MYEVLIREAGARFGLDNKALSVVQVLLAEMTNKEKGGLAGFLEPFKAAGFGPIIQSWLGGGPSAQPIGNRQLEEVLGTSGGLLQTLSARLDVERDALTSALGYLLPALVGKLSVGGSVPSHYPPEVLSLAEAGQQLLSAPIVEPPASGGLMKWFPWLVLIAALVAGLVYWNANREQATAVAPVVGNPTEAIPAPVLVPAPEQNPDTQPAGDAVSVAEPPQADSEAPTDSATPAESAAQTETAAPEVQDAPATAASEPAQAQANANQPASGESSTTQD